MSCGPAPVPTEAKPNASNRNRDNREIGDHGRAFSSLGTTDLLTKVWDKRRQGRGDRLYIAR